MRPNVALLVCTTSSLPPAGTASRTSPSYATSKQITSPIRAGPTSRTPGFAPRAKSRGTRSTLLLIRRANDRNGMYSPNGTGCRFTYSSPGPVTGSQTMPALRTLSPGPSSTAPTRTGTPMSWTAAA